MNDQSFKKLSKDQQELVISNVVEAVKLLYESVKRRKIKEFLDEIKNEGNKNEKFNRI